MNYHLKKYNKIEGYVDLPSSKSLAHRYIIIASCLNEETIIRNVWYSDDVQATINICNLLNNNVIYERNNKIVKIIQNKNRKELLNNSHLLFCSNSGSTFRIISTMLLFVNDQFKIDAGEQMRSRNIDDLIKLTGIENKFPIVTKPIIDSSIILDGSLSSQYISGAILGHCLFNDNIEIKIKNVSSLPYINLTLDVLKQFGIESKFINNVLKITSSGYKVRSEYVVESDMTHAINFLVLKKLGFNININNINYDSKQADTNVIKLINNEQEIIDASDFPDSVAILCLYYSFCNRIVTFTNVDRLMHKESNRIESTINTLKKFNINITYEDRKIFIKKSIPKLLDNNFNSYDDHRVVFLSTIGALYLGESITINNYEAINKSFPTFFDVIEQIGKGYNEKTKKEN